MTDRNDGRPRHSASHMHCAVPFFLCPKRNGRGGSVALRGRAKVFRGEWVMRSARACRCAGASEGLWRGMGCEGCGECIAQPKGVRRGCVGVRRGCVGERKCSGRACRCAGASEGLRRGVSCEGCGECIAQPAGVRRRCVGGGSARRGRVAVRGRAKAVGEECIAQPAGVHRRCVGERKCSARACRCAGASEGLWRGMGGEVGGFNAHSPQ